MRNPIYSNRVVNDCITTSAPFPEPAVVDKPQSTRVEGPALLSRWEKLGRGGTEDETVKPLEGVQRVPVPHGQSEQAGR